MIAWVLMQAALAGVPGFPQVQPTEAERLALPHIADALRATDAPPRMRSLDAALALLPEPTRFRAAFQCIRGAMLLSADPVANKAAGIAAVDECYAKLPDVPTAQRIRADTLLSTGQFRQGADLLARAITADPRLARGIPDEGLDTVFRQLGYLGAQDERRRLVVALSRSDAAAGDAARYSGWVREAVQERVERGDLSGAAALLPYVVDPADGIAMLIDRRFEPLWPRIEEWSGGTLEAQRGALVAATRVAYDADPTLNRARETAGVLARTGYLPDGLALLERAVTAFGEPRDDYGYARGVVRLSKLRAQAGERDPARVVQPMVAALANGSGTYLVNVVPNLALAQTALGQPEAALAALDRYPTTPGKVETAAAYGYFVAIRGCALAKLGRAKEARAAFSEVRARYATNQGASDLATGCGGTDAEVAADWLKAVDGPASRSGALMAMTLAAAGAAGDPLSPTAGRLKAVATRPEVVVRMARYGRALPAGYRPALIRLGGT